ncbi:MAG: phosphoribosylglycinamide formyltransferase [Candidatus Heimdallarchaeota archaeon]|nr:phosphoribosylglycinamide formyltransferase [Candidatus Heimdallarchaeota archaeon]MCK5049352.1 phosphoribosylglycinamide formyltransferase [Candidatus Heimdallarchaeota archaeon]
MKIAILISGRGTNLQALIDADKEEKLSGKIVVVISDNSEAYGLERAKKAFIPIEVLKEEEEISRKLKELGVDLVVLAGFMKMLSEEFVKERKNAIINIHPSLLPSFKGLNAQKQAIDYGVKVSGCTTHFVDEGMDTGPIILQKEVEIEKNETVETLSNKILAEEHKMLVKTVELFCNEKLIVEGRKVIIKE